MGDMVYFYILRFTGAVFKGHAQIDDPHGVISSIHWLLDTGNWLLVVWSLDASYSVLVTDSPGPEVETRNPEPLPIHTMAIVKSQHNALRHY